MHLHLFSRRNFLDATQNSGNGANLTLMKSSCCANLIMWLVVGRQSGGRMVETLPHPSLHMNYPPTALLPTSHGFREAQCASCRHTDICGLHSPRPSDTLSPSSRPYVCVCLPWWAYQLLIFHRNLLQATSVLPIQMFLRCALAGFCYSTRILSLQGIWTSFHSQDPDVYDMDLENAPISRRTNWTETIQKMKRFWTLIAKASSLIITWVLLLPITGPNCCLYSKQNFSRLPPDRQNFE